MNDTVPQMGLAMIGTGMVAGTYLAALRDTALPLRLRCVYQRDAAGCAAFAARASEMLGYPVRACTGIDDIAAAPGVDIALVLTPPDVRHAVIAPLAQAGRAILVEKPVARTLAEAREVVALCTGAGVPLGVVFQHRMRAASRAAAALVDSGQLGSLGLLELSVPWWREQAYYDAPGRGTYARDGGGVLISQAIHTIDLALALAGPVTEVVAMTGTTPFHRMEAEDTAVAGLRLAGGALGWLTATTAAYPGAAERITLHFDAARLDLAEGRLEVAWRDGRRESTGTESGTGGGADPMAFTHAWHQSVIEDFARAVAAGTRPAVTGADALAAHALIEAITRSAATGRPASVEQG